MVTSAPLTLRMKKTKIQMRRMAKSLVTRPQWPIGASLYSGCSAHKYSNLRSYNAITCSRFSSSSATVEHVSLLMEVANLVSSDLVKKLGLTTCPHPRLYHIQWLNDSGKAKVTQTCRVSFFIGSYANSVDCDVVPMQACSLLLVILGNMIMMLHTMVEVINTPLSIKDRKLLWYL